MKKKSKLVVLGLIENHNNEFLLSQRYDPNVPEANLKWDLPGGTNEFGESLEETLEREILEETGLSVNILEMFPKSISKLWDHKEYKQHTVVVCYYCKQVAGKLHLNDHKVQDLRWVSLSEIESYDFLPTTRCFIEMLLSKNPVSQLTKLKNLE